MTGFNQSNNTRLGKIVEPWTCCDPTFDVFNGVGQQKYTIRAVCCQCGLLCNKCSEVKFDIFSTFNSNEGPVGSITKKFSGLLQEMFTDADNFEVIFPNDATPEDKLMLIGATLMIDFRHFEDNGEDSKKGFKFSLN